MIINLLANNGYIVLNKTLMKKVGLHEAILLGELSSEYVYWNKRNELEDGYFYSTRENIEEQTMLSSHQQRIAIENLKKLDILKMKQIGMPSKNYYSIEEDALVKILNGDGNFVNILANDNFIVVNKSVMKTLGLHEAIILGELSSEMLHWETEGLLEDGYFYSTRENIEEQTMLSAYSQRIALENLKRVNVLNVTQKGMPLRTWYTINEQVLSQILLGNGLISSSEKIEHQDVKNFNIKSLNNSTSCCEKIEHHVVKKLNTNNNKNNNKNMIDRLFNYIIDKDENLPRGFNTNDVEKAKVLLNEYGMLYNQEMLEIFTPDNLEKIKTITYVIVMLSKSNMPNVDMICNRDRLIAIYDWCKEKQTLYEDTENEISDFYSYYHKSVVNEILKQKKTNYVENKNNEGEDEDEEYEC